MIETIKNAVHGFAISLVGLVGLSEAFANYVYVLIISMLPIIELRGALPVAFALGLPVIPSFIVSIVGNVLPVPFILLLITPFCNWLKKTRFFSWLPAFLERKVEKNREKVTKYANFGLFLFVAIPLPGTGAWTGALIASFLDFKFKDALISIIGGVIAAGLIMGVFSYGLLGLIF